MDGEDAETETITVTCTWKSYHQVEVPAGFRVPSTLSDFPPDVLEKLTSDTAELVDWE